MTTHLDQTIADLQEEVRQKELETLTVKRMINSLCVRAKRPVIYADSELKLENRSGAIRSDQFYGRTLVTCVREILEMRKSSNQGAAPIEEIMSALETGGYELNTIADEKDIQKRGVAISLAKNSYAFHRLPNGYWGLSEWYPNAKEKKGKADEETAPKAAKRPKAPESKDEEQSSEVKES